MLESESLLRLGAFLVVFSAVGVWECAVPRRERAFSRRSRWPHNLGLFFVDVIVVLVSGSVVTWLVVPQPRGSGTTTTRSAWSAALGFFAAVPVCYLVLVLVVQVIEPLLA